jgi:competence protein ComEC
LLAGIVLSTLIASAAVAPFGAYHFHKSQQYAVLANLVAMPVCNLVVMPGALATLLAMPFGIEALPLWAMGQGIDAMVWTAKRVAELPGAVAHLPALPASAFLLIVAGGLWLVIWRTRWRLLGLTVIAAGVALAPTARLPDILVGRDGALVAVRDDAGQLATLGSARSYELERWLEHDGDARTPAQAVKAARLRCDGVGCRATANGVPVAIARHPAAFADDCRTAAILVSSTVSPKSCTGPKAVIDFFAVRREGPHAVYVADDGTVRVETVAARRGARPWSPPVTPRPASP